MVALEQRARVHTSPQACTQHLDSEPTAPALQGLEGRAKVHAQVTRGGMYCEHADVLEGTPAAFSGRVLRMRQLAD